MLLTIPDNVFFNQICKYLSYEDIDSISKTSKSLQKLVQKGFQKNNETKTFTMGPWYGTYDMNHLYFRGEDTPVNHIECKSYVYRNVDHSYDTYYHMHFYVNTVNHISHDTSAIFYQTIKFKNLLHWANKYLYAPKFKTIIHTSIRKEKLKEHKLETIYQKRDHCNAIGITLCWHKYIFPNPLPPPIENVFKIEHIFENKDYTFTQRIGFDFERNSVDVVTTSGNKRKYLLQLKSELSIHTSDNKSLHVNDTDSNKYYTPSLPVFTFGADFTFSKNKCIAETHLSKSTLTMKSEQYIFIMELFANAIKTILVQHSYEDFIENSLLMKLNPIIVKWYSSDATIEDIEFDFPKTTEEVWNLLQNMELCQIYSES